MILAAILLFSVVVAIASARFIVDMRAAIAVTVCVTLLLPWLGLLYIGHPNVGVTLGDLVLLSLGSVSVLLVTVWKRRRR